MSFGVDRVRHLAGVFELVERAVAESHREGLKRAVDETRHDRCDGAAIEATRQEHPQRHVTHQPQTNRFLEQIEETIRDLCV